jgi:hypothetical protein
MRLDYELLKTLSEELGETKRLAIAAEKPADAAMRKTDAAWELVIITRNQVQEEILI